MKALFPLKVLVSALILSAAMTFSPAQASEPSPIPLDVGDMTCPDANVLSGKMLSSVCWDCLFPIRIAGQPINSGNHNSPPRAANTGFCFCPGCGFIGRFGVTVGYWSPSRLVEVVRTPYCMPSLGGEVMGDFSPNVSRINVGQQATAQRGEDASDAIGFAHFHYYTYPILALLGMMDTYDCVDDGVSDFDLLFMSEVYPQWANDSLSHYLTPEAGLFGNIVAALAQPIDCLAATAYKPIDTLFWMSGCWGSHYPLTGHTVENLSPISAASLRVSRGLFLLHRIGLAKRQGGNDAVCKPVRETTMSKSFYRAQQFWPHPETKGGDQFVGGDGSDDRPFDLGSMLPVCCHALGANTMAWGEHRTTIGTGEDYVHLAWRWMDCCVGVCI